MPTNLLVFYQGGGYDGCIWEWNYFSFDKDGKFHNLFASGRAGIKTEEEALNLSDTHPYDLTNDEDIREFQRENPAPTVIALVKNLNSGKYGEYANKLYFVCDDCDANVYEGGQAVDWHGCGGIMSTADRMVCDDCYSAHTCSECGEYDKDTVDMCTECEKQAMANALSRLKNYFILEYVKRDNVFVATEYDGSDFNTDLNWWDVTIHQPEGHFHYLVEAETEFLAIDYVDTFLGSKYYTAEAERFNLQRLLWN